MAAEQRQFIECVLLGTRDAEIDAKRNTSSCFTSKIGELPNCFPSLTLRYPSCSICNGILVHVVQVYCPLEGSPYHRTVNVFACPSRECFGKSESWTVLRSQCLETEATQAQEPKANKVAAMATRDWCEGADDWGMDEETESSAPPANSSMETDFTSQLQGLNLREQTQSSVPAGEGLLLPGPVPTFQPYYISVVDEGEFCVDADMDHAQRLLKEYQTREGVDVQQLISCDGEGESEKYEKTKARHGDEIFLKFMKKISVCQEQVLRYSRKGQPLFITSPPSNVKQMVPCCRSCGSPRIFEFQIMPALVSMLKSINTDGLTVEFGTVLIYTCEKSCWPPSNQTPLEEFLFVQTDPDQKFFK
ncbi:programmed cell death protein 2-like [Acipenser oxyrinchus oxyrinchus]|uniref:Programmed cell death protein 2-like n=1 Tax=Acipenser oxyrinchus oxyrinchus TaxID=40147 RepID=A0AAD8G0Q8_ACIOX|nr:programmed cell death protein 2-like [Acipenser oxyrinchus oxyrinchus]